MPKRSRAPVKLPAVCLPLPFCRSEALQAQARQSALKLWNYFYSSACVVMRVSVAGCCARPVFRLFARSGCSESLFIYIGSAVITGWERMAGHGRGRSGVEVGEVILVLWQFGLSPLLLIHRLGASHLSRLQGEAELAVEALQLVATK